MTTLTIKKSHLKETTTAVTTGLFAGACLTVGAPLLASAPVAFGIDLLVFGALVTGIGDVGPGVLGWGSVAATVNATIGGTFFSAGMAIKESYKKDFNFEANKKIQNIISYAVPTAAALATAATLAIGHFYNKAEIVNINESHSTVQDFSSASRVGGPGGPTARDYDITEGNSASSCPSCEESSSHSFEKKSLPNPLRLQRQ